MDKTQENLFKEGLKQGDMEKLRKVSKGELHNHSGTGTRFSTFNKWTGGKVNKAPKKMDGMKGLGDYISNEVSRFIHDEQGVEFLIEETVKEAILDGVKVLETSIDCMESLHFKEHDDFFNMISRIKNRYSEEIDFRPELGIHVNISNEDLDRLIIPCIDSGVFSSIDSYGDETKEHLERLKEYYKYAREKDLKLKIHAGQLHGADKVKEAIEILDIDEIQHGIGASSSDYVMDLIKERKLRLNVCPTSNYTLGAVKTMDNYPAKKLFDKGIPITINSDDLLLFDSGVSEEYLFLYKLGIFDADELNEIRKNSLISRVRV